MPKQKQNRKPGIHLHTTEILMPAKKGKSKSETYISKEFYWTLIAKNGKTIARSTDTHKRKAVALRSMKVAADIFAESVGLTGGHYFDHTGQDGADILNYDYK